MQQVWEKDLTDSMAQRIEVVKDKSLDAPIFVTSWRSAEDFNKFYETHYETIKAWKFNLEEPELLLPDSYFGFWVTTALLPEYHGRRDPVIIATAQDESCIMVRSESEGLRCVLQLRVADFRFIAGFLPTIY
jgi:hypothetical protein